METSSSMESQRPVDASNTECSAALDLEPCLGSGEVVVGSPLRESAMIKGDTTNSEPCVGMKFESEETAYVFYNEYARRVGFGISRKSSRRSRTNRAFIAGQYVCSRHGFRRPNKKANNPRPLTRIGCQAMMKIKRMEPGKWVILEFVKEHNHELDPDNVHCFRSHKHNGTNDMNRIRRASRIQLSKFDSASGKQSTRSKAEGPTENDSKNDTCKDHKKSLTAGDGHAIYERFTNMQASNLTFFYAMELDEEQCFKNVFWLDAKSRMDYTHFGDVVTFDTTYLRNKYQIPLATFVGVNHHGQSILLGCALISDDTTSSFTWVFRTWLMAMSGKPPVAIIIDQGMAIEAAVVEVFPNTRHRFCLWHMLKSVPVRLGYICKTQEKFMEKFEKCIYDSVTTDEFERRWGKLIERFDLMMDHWLLNLYEDRKKWVLAYLKDTFFGGMSISRRGESLKSYFDNFVSPTTTVKDFLEQYETALQDTRETEIQADFKTFHTKPSLKTPSPFESQVASIYTRDMFLKAQTEVSGIAACHTINSQQGATATYTVKDLERRKDYPVTWNSLETKVSCICRSFEFNGYLCRHAMAVLVASGTYEIPSHYILKRWTKNARSRHVLDQGIVGLQDDCLESKVDRFNDLCQRSIKFAEEGSVSKESYVVALHALQEALQKVVLENDPLGKLAQNRAFTSNCHYKVNEGIQMENLTEVPRTVGSRSGEEHIQEKERYGQLIQEGWSQRHYVQGGAVALGNTTPCPSAWSTREVQQMGQSGLSSFANQCGTQDSLQFMG
ncbi:protein FAR1-RELATED SEQUENCE 4-like isoform X2 [Aristolochia californica]|uniref:protein FAR1-RELATED SEQUENCE 4-like isoform X2 n=1 Tax=Aristolochia californica TaxID=171875 RepID=UPI0035E2C500